jgi:DNA mismatch endonuclease, patch repair protein
MTADVVFRPTRVAVEVLGCFWHGCPAHYSAPASNADYWSEKVRRNQRRDEENAVRLERAGWVLEVVWEHEDPVKASQRIAAVILERRQELDRAERQRGR